MRVARALPHGPDRHAAAPAPARARHLLPPALRSRMQIEHGARLESSAMLRCPRCSHRIRLFGGARVPRCYCGGEQFEVQPDRADAPPAAPAPRADRPAPRAPEAPPPG